MLFAESICNRIDSNIRILLHNIRAVNRLFLSYAFNYCEIFVIIPQRYTVPRSSVNPAIPYPKKSDQNTLVIRGRVLGVVASSDRPSKDDISILEELFIDEIREFYEEHGVNE